MENIKIIEEILKRMKEERDKIDKKMVSGLYSVDECRNEFGEVSKCIDIILGVAKENLTKDEIRKIILCLRDFK